MRFCFRGIWTCSLVSDNHHLVWKYHLFNKSTFPPFCLHSYGGLCHLLTSPDYAAEIQHGFTRSTMLSSESTSVIVCVGFRLLLTFSRVKPFLSLDLSMFEVRSLSRLWTGMRLMYPVAECQWQCQRRLCLHSVNELLLSCFYRASLWLQRFLWGSRRLDVFAPSLSVWSQMSWRNL